MRSRKPDFFIVGAQRSGTTAMYAFLRQHPEIFMPVQKEPNFFGTDLEQRFFIRDEKEYLSLFAPARSEARVGEASTWYLVSERAAAEIKAFCPFASIIIMLRNPVDMLYSLHNERLHAGSEDIEDFEAALEAEPDRLRGLRIPKLAFAVDHNLNILSYREHARYAQQVKRYLDVFGRQNVRVIIYDDFTARTAQVYRETCKFLGVDEEFRPEFRIFNASKRVRSRVFRYLLRLPSPAARRLVKAVVPARPLERVRQGLVRLNTRYESRPPMDPHLRSRLQAEFLPEVEQLSELLDRDLTHWCRD